MNARSSSGVVATFASLVVLACVSVALAEQDHLKGYKVKDRDKVRPSGTQTLTTQFGDETCELKRAKFWLVQSEKNAGDDPRGGAAGDFVCYRAKCSGPLPPATTVDDQFATHTLEAKRARLVCVPVDALPPGQACTASPHPTCGGTCPAGQECGDVGSSCACLPTGSTPCGDGPHPACGGACPQPGQSCTTNSDVSFCFCSSGTCGSPPACGGSCLPGEICAGSGFACVCAQ